MTFIIFGAEGCCTYLLALLPVRRMREALPANVWPPIPFVAMNYILFAFILDFSRFQTYGLIDVVKCLPFLALAICAPILRLAAWAKTALPSSPVRLSRKIGRSADSRWVRTKFQGRPPKRLKRAAPMRSFCISVVPST
jgi:hypothetical protein